MEEQIVYKRVDELKLNEKNPRKNDSAVKEVAESIKQFGFRSPLIIKDDVVWCGNTRLKAAKLLGLEKVPCLVADDLTKTEIRKLALLDNKLNEIAEWDIDWGIDDIFENNGNISSDNPYTMKVDVPQYQITGECPTIKELINEDKVKELEKEIQESDLTKEQKDFLIKASKRHLVFDYGKIAEYYAHQDKKMQEFMEKSALVIIDFNDAMKNGFVEIRKEIEDIINGEEDE